MVTRSNQILELGSEILSPQASHLMTLGIFWISFAWNILIVPFEFWLLCSDFVHVINAHECRYLIIVVGKGF